MNRIIALLMACASLPGCSTMRAPAPPMVCAPSVSCPALDCPAPTVVTERIEVPVEVQVPVPATQHVSGNKELLVIGAREFVTLLESGITLEARVDTGAETSSLHALAVTPFERDGRRWVRFQIPKEPGSEELVTLTQRVRRTVLIRQVDAPDQRRYVVSLWARVGDIREKLSFTLADRGNFDYPVLLGRNFIIDTAIVDVSRKHILQ